jgi:hypothetical protein
LCLPSKCFFCSLSSWCFKTTYSWLFLESYPQSFISFPSFWKKNITMRPLTKQSNH